MQQIFKGFIADHLGNFSPSEIPNFLFALFLSALMNYLLTLLLKRRTVEKNDLGLSSSLIFFGLGATILTSIVKQSLPLAIASLALLAFVRPKKEKNSWEESIFVFLSLIIGIACGAGFGLVMVLAFIVIAMILMLKGKKKDPQI